MSLKIHMSLSPECVNMLPHKAKWTLQMHLRILRWGDDSRLSRCPQCNNKYLKAEPFPAVVKGDTTELDLKKEDWVIRQEMQGKSRSRKTWRNGSLLEPPKGTQTQSCSYLDFSPEKVVTHLSDFWAKEQKDNRLWCFKSLNLLWCVTAAIEN